MTFVSCFSRNLARAWRLCLPGGKRRALLFVGLAVSAVFPLNLAAGALSIRQPWVRWLPAGLPAGGYFDLTNSSRAEAVLVAATSPDYQSVQLHESYTAADGSARMRPVERLVVPPGGRLRFAPGGYHLMLMHARRPIAPGDEVTVEFEFEDGRRVRAKFPVKSPDGGE